MYTFSLHIKIVILNNSIHIKYFASKYSVSNFPFASHSGYSLFFKGVNINVLIISYQ